jgi:thioredoxin-related protein
MQKILFQLFLFLFLSISTVFGQSEKPDSAQNIIKAAITEARSVNKNVLLIFHATWCGWCKRLEAAFENPEIKSIIEKHFVIAKLDVEERGEKIQTHENPGGQQILTDLGGRDAGLPFLVFLNKKGVLLVNSNVMPEGKNIGYPGSKDEIAAFLELLKKAAPQLTQRQRTTISRYFEKNAPQ